MFPWLWKRSCLRWQVFRCCSDPLAETLRGARAGFAQACNHSVFCSAEQWNSTFDSGLGEKVQQDPKSLRLITETSQRSSSRWCKCYISKRPCVCVCALPQHVCISHVLALNSALSLQQTVHGWTLLVQLCCLVSTRGLHTLTRTDRQTNKYTPQIYTSLKPVSQKNSLYSNRFPLCWAIVFFLMDPKTKLVVVVVIHWNKKEAGNRTKEKLQRKK